MVRRVIENIVLSREGIDGLIAVLDTSFPRSKAGYEHRGVDYTDARNPQPHHNLFFTYTTGIFLIKTVAEVRGISENGTTFTTNLEINVADQKMYEAILEQLRTKAPEVYGILCDRTVTVPST